MLQVVALSGAEDQLRDVFKEVKRYAELAVYHASVRAVVAQQSARSVRGDFGRGNTPVYDRLGECCSMNLACLCLCCSPRLVLLARMGWTSCGALVVVCMIRTSSGRKNRYCRRGEGGEGSGRQGESLSKSDGLDATSIKDGAAAVAAVTAAADAVEQELRGSLATKDEALRQAFHASKFCPLVGRWCAHFHLIVVGCCCVVLAAHSLWRGDTHMYPWFATPQLD